MSRSVSVPNAQHEDAIRFEVIVMLERFSGIVIKVNVYRQGFTFNTLIACGTSLSRLESDMCVGSCPGPPNKIVCRETRFVIVSQDYFR